MSALSVLAAALLLAAPAPRSQRDVAYGSAPAQRLDLQLPEGPQPAPLFLFVHGGAWTQGDKVFHTPHPDFFLQRGWAWASANYRLAPAVRHPEQVQDLARAVGWLYRNASARGLDPQRFVLCGFSAGAHLVALLVADPRYLAAEGVPLSAVRGVVLLDGAGYDVPRHAALSPRLRQVFHVAFGEPGPAWEDASPVTHLRQKRAVPPFLVFYTGEGPRAGQQARLLTRALEHAGGHAELYPAPGKDHVQLSVDLGKSAQDGPTARTLAFLERVRREAK
ncbi:alpha/beta hydrolase [Aggregicoccus sp. 17bor-14]|uniref:alpha/beta hydrolase n=1 Tax=Myxococcaceae TaxID=31 RepID=UPI00129C4CD0|nr:MULTISPECIES: alpha/beta hydrolase [Myxococcaceae]MBF5046254.1 alpha/beta hydrolase [Simulacricoccus sp. 17bor-14]MRI91977.1 alpha/beta hydrolase [Aggregicoccus sp. 17bor-14]